MQKIFINLLFFLMLSCLGQAQNLEIKLAFNENVSKKSVTGRVFVFFNRNTSASFGRPRINNPIPSFSMDVKDWKVGEFITITSKNATSWMGNLDSLAGWYSVQAIIKINFQEKSLNATGNGFTDKNVVYIENGSKKNPVYLLFNNISSGTRKFHESEFIKEIKIESKIISAFYGNKEYISAAVILPKSYYQNTTKLYPCVYLFPAWGSSHNDLSDDDFQFKRYGMGPFCIGEEKIFIYIDHDCRNGYHEFCNSENNGNREQSFFDEVIPYVEQNYRVSKTANTRFLMGHSSGAWAALWLLVNNPDKFAGAFVTSPDPVDFTSFLGEDIYNEKANWYYTTTGQTKYFYKGISMKEYLGLDKLLGSGEQMFSFNATFSKKGKDGSPEKLFDWETGLVNPTVTKNWANYDLSKIVAKLDKQKKVQLSNKIHIYVSEDDDFGLNIPVKSFKNVLDKTEINSEIIFFEKGGHTGVWTEELTKNIHNQMDFIIKSGTIK